MTRPIADSMVDRSPQVQKADGNVDECDMEWNPHGVVKPSLDHVYFFTKQKNQDILLQPCRNENAGVTAANHTKKQLTSNLRQETGDRSLLVPHKVHIRPLDHVSCPIIQRLPDEVLPHRETPLTKPSATLDLAIELLPLRKPLMQFWTPSSKRVITGLSAHNTVTTNLPFIGLVQISPQCLQSPARPSLRQRISECPPWSIYLPTQSPWQF